MTVLVQNSCLLPHKLVSYPQILTKFPFWHPLYTRLFVIVTAVCLFQANCSPLVNISKVGVFILEQHMYATMDCV